jgi:23S rRNA pseudouridine1911/1915/1917 synthase
MTPFITILYEDEDILVINKPAGLVVHGDGRTEEPTVTEWIVENYPESKNVGEPIVKSDGGLIERSGIVHRIDRETSGVLLLAKTDKGFEALKKQFKNREIEKVYRLFVYGGVKEDHGTINLPIGRSTSDFRKWSAERGARGEKREAVTYFKVLGRGKDVTLVEAKPKTGRTHQIRVHFKALHHPVVGDSLYASAKNPLLGFNRLALHAYSVIFKNTKGEKVAVTAPYPDDFLKALGEIGVSA